ncbi:MAG: sulfite reductase subunit alpha [Verrucomicrobiota bacterium]
MSEPAVYSRKNPFPATLKVHEPLCGEGSVKDIRHFELCLAGSGLTYDLGDSLGVVPQNDPELVDEIISILGLDPEEVVPTPDKSEAPLRKALLEKCNITSPSRKFMKDFAERADSDEMRGLLEKERAKEFTAYVEAREIVDFFIENPGVKMTGAELTGLLGKLQPRLYSIASSLKVHPDEVHLTIARVAYETLGRKRKGVCSTYLSDRAPDGTQMPVFVHAAKGFKPPEDDSAPMIMVGPGTGIAPFRAFLEERVATDAPGKNWLIFGNPHSKTDYLYGEQFEGYKASGKITRLDLAWSRDQEHKIYVQDKIKEAGAELWKWLEEGAYFYVCGDAIYMAKDVDDALHQAIAEFGGMSAEAAAEYVEQMKKDKRYQRDVY